MRVEAINWITLIGLKPNKALPTGLFTGSCVANPQTAREK